MTRQRLHRCFAAMMTAMALILPAVNSRAQDLTYLDHGETRLLNGDRYFVLNNTNINEQPLLQEGESFYVVKGNVKCDHPLLIDGVVNLLLTDGCVLDVPYGVHVPATNAVGQECALIIYAQRLDEYAGTLLAGEEAGEDCAGIGGQIHETCGGVIINGGNIVAKGGRCGAGIGGGGQGGWAGTYGSGGHVEIYGGNVTAIGGGHYSAGIGGGGYDPDFLASNTDVVPGSGGTVRLAGGKVVARGGVDGYGIGPGRHAFADGAESNLFIFWPLYHDAYLGMYDISSAKAVLWGLDPYVFDKTGEEVTEEHYTGAPIVPYAGGTLCDVQFISEGEEYCHWSIVSGRLLEQPEPPTPSDPSMRFIEWRYRGEPYDFSIPVEYNLVLEAYFAQAQDLANATVADIPDQLFCNQELCPRPTVTYNGSVLTLGNDYCVSYSNNLNVGEATVEITGILPYEGSITKTYNILPRDINDDVITVDMMRFESHDGLSHYPGVNMYYGDIKLIQNTDFTVDYQGGNYKSCGDYTVMVTGINNYTGTMPLPFSIVDNVQYLAYNTETGKMESKSCSTYDHFSFLDYYNVDNLHDGWYVVGRDIASDERVTVTGDVKLILMDGTTFTARSGIEVAGDCSLTIYAQSEGESTGRLVIPNETESEPGIGDFDDSGHITIHGGKIEVQGRGSTPAIGGVDGIVNIYGGDITAYAGLNTDIAIHANILNISWGNLDYSRIELQGWLGAHRFNFLKPFAIEGTKELANPSNTYNNTLIPAEWIITFDSDGGSDVPQQAVRTNDTANCPSGVMKENQICTAWLLDGAEYDFSTPVTSDITLLAYYGQATVIEDVNADDASDVVRYNLLGQPVGPEYKGVVIERGRKILVP